MGKKKIDEKILVDLLAKAEKMGANEIEIEYKDGYEEVFACGSNLGLGIDRIKAGTQEASQFLSSIRYIVQRKRKTLQSGDLKYRIDIEVYDSFMEDAYLIRFARI